MIKPAIITVTYNSSDKIERFLNSLLLNSSNIKEVFIIENNSPDKLKTETICKKYSKKLHLTFTFNQNVGFGKSCNLGVTLSKSKYFIFLNPDTELNEGSLETLINHYSSNNADIIGGKALTYQGKPHGSAVRIPNLFIGIFEFSNLGKLLKISGAHKKFYYEDREILKSIKDEVVDAVSGGYMLTNKEVWNKLKGFDENIFMYLEDVDFGKRAKDIGLKTVFCPHSVIWHVGGASSKNKYRINHQSWFDSRKYYYRKHFGLLSNTIIQAIYTVEEYFLKKFKSI